MNNICVFCSQMLHMYVCVYIYILLLGVFVSATKIVHWFGERGRGVKTLDSISRGLGFDSHGVVMCESLGKALNPHHLLPPSSNGYQVERKLVHCEWLELQKIALHFPRDMWLWTREFQYLGVIYIKSAEWGNLEYNLNYLFFSLVIYIFLTAS